MSRTGTVTEVSTMTSKVVATLAAVLLAGGVFASAARAAGKCNPHICSAEIATTCAGLKGMDHNRCKKSIVGNCKTNPDCSCDGSVPTPCTPSTTSTTTPTTTTTTMASPSGAFVE
jgi:hypothetical protein